MSAVTEFIPLCFFHCHKEDMPWRLVPEKQEWCETDLNLTHGLESSLTVPSLDQPKFSQSIKLCGSLFIMQENLKYTCLQ